MSMGGKAMVDHRLLDETEAELSCEQGSAAAGGSGCTSRELLPEMPISEDQWRLLVDAIPQIVWTSRPDGCIDYFNQRWFDYTGLTPEETFPMEEWKQVLDPEDVESWTGHWEQAVRAGESCELHCRLKRASDGAHRWHLGRATPLRDQAGRIVKWFGTFTDIDRQKRAAEEAEATLRQANQRTSMILESITDHFYSVDREWRFTEVNRRAEDNFGKTREELLGKVLMEVFPQSLDTETYKHYQKAMAEQIPVHCEAESRIVPRWYEAYAFPSERGLDIYFRDVTDRKRLEEELRKQAEELVEADRRKDQFLAMLGHELRNPLATIANALHLSGQRQSGDPTLDRSRELIERELQQIARLTDDLLDVSRIGRGKIEIRHQRLDLAGIVRETIEARRSAVEEAGLTLGLELPPEPAWVTGDPIRLTQVLANLLQNAIKFTDAGGQITIRLVTDDRWARVTVSDTGVGIEPEMLPRVFETFTQAEWSRGRSRGGLGLGLALVKGLIELHGGEVSIHSAGLGQGAEVRFALPLRRSRG
jgi:PAS domain S-box-containing protein